MRLFFIAAFTLLVQYVFGQKKVELTFENGEVLEVTIDYDDPEVLPRWSTDIRLGTIMGIGWGAMGCQMTPQYRINNKWLLEGGFAFPYMDFNRIGTWDRKKFANRTTESFIRANRTLLSHVGTKLRKYYVKNEVDRKKGVVVEYVAKMPRQIQTSLAFSGGIGRYNLFKNADLYRSPDTRMLFILGNTSNISLNAGLSLFKTQSIKTIEDKPMREWKIFRLYALYSLGVADNYSVLKDDPSLIDISDRYTEVSSGYTEPGRTPMGYRIGIEHKSLRAASKMLWTWGAEFGKLPGIYLENKPSIVMLHWGIGFAAEPKQL